MPGNEALYCDTDSVILSKPLNKKYLSKTELGKLKLEFEFNECIIIAKKFYGLKDENGKTKIRTKGLKKGKVKYQDLEKLYEGQDLSTKTTIFKKDLTKGTIYIEEHEYSIKGNHPPSVAALQRSLAAE